MFFYRELQSPADLRHLVLSFWEFTVRSDLAGPFDHEIFPDGCLSLIYRRNTKQGWFGFATNNLHDRSIVVPVFAGDIFWGVRLSPAAAAEILGTDPAFVEKHLWQRDTGTPAEYGIFDLELLLALEQVAEFQAAAGIFGERLRSLNIPRERVDDPVLKAVDLIEDHGGEIRIGAVAESLGLSLRQFERRFRRTSGLTPKQYARARRLRAAAAIVAVEESMNWADRAAALGFADQAHLSHEISSITGRSPKSLARKIKTIKHGPLVK